MTRRTFLVVLILALSPRAEAAEPYVGIWSEDLKLCKSGDFHWTFTATRAYNEAFTCGDAAYAKTGPGRWTVHMKNCVNEEAKFDNVERIAVHGDVLEWNSKSYHRCPEDKQGQ